MTVRVEFFVFFVEAARMCSRVARASSMDRWGNFHSDQENAFMPIDSSRLGDGWSREGILWPAARAPEPEDRAWNVQPRHRKM